MKILNQVFLWLFLASIATAGTVQDPTVQVYLVKGDVTLINLESGEKQPLQRGDLISEGYAIETQVDSSALLLFSNGSSINIIPESFVKIAEFTQEPFEMAAKSYALLGEDPSTSNTTLELHYGKVVGSVRKLQPTSSYTINSPTGSAGIRGTTFVFATITKSDASLASAGELQSAITSLSVGEGVVDLTVNGNTYTVNAGESKTITVTFNDGTTGELLISAIDAGETGPMTTDDAALLEQINQDLTDAQNNEFLISPGGDEGDLVLTPLETGNLINMDGGTVNVVSPF
ncbi:FecR family protein [Cerasicoccus maritimus]|uniref:FecR family protein n=1 Tax=Cerasicoccus maritimus TaxID=490089 RepID=UPI002852C7F9|nr:FecR domain-containing protein [Cerasicoccus maritimus]